MILDLEARGLLDETLVLCMSEHGRTPRVVSNVRGGGRVPDRLNRPMAIAGDGEVRPELFG